MGQATLDLPDPAEQPPAPAADADELLSQLAGEEIDRMLADADAGPATPTAGGDAPTVAPAPASPAAEVAAAVAEGAAAPAVDAGPDAGLPHDAEVTVDASELSELLAAVPEPTPLPPSPASGAAPVVSDSATTAAELAALAQPPDLAATLDKMTQQAQANRPSLIIRMLELINAPLNSCSPQIRDLVGKLAILTFMNAIGVLLYLVLFRR